MNRRKLLIGAGALVAAGTVGGAASLKSMGTMAEYEANAAESRRALAANADVAELVRYATLAPNGHNTQPWGFHIATDRIEIVPDFKRRTPVVDPDDHHLFISLGCAAENLALASVARGRLADIHFDSEGGGRVICDLGTGRPRTSALFEAIPARQSTRAEYDGRELSAAEVAKLHQAADVTGTKVILVTERPAIDKVRDLVIAGNSRQMADPAFVQELRNWIRF